MAASSAPVDLLIDNARHIATVDADRRELAGGWVAIDAGRIAEVGTGPPPAATETLDASDCLVTPGLVNTHHHLYQNLTRSHPVMTSEPLFGWLTSLYPVWRQLDADGAYLSAWIGLAELALSGCTTSSDHLYIHPRRGGDVLAASIDAASDLGLRFHPTHGSMSLSRKDGGLPPDDIVLDDDEALAAAELAVTRHHDPAFGAMVRVAIAPCSPFSVTERLMAESAALAERLDVRLHTHFAENDQDDAFSLEQFGCRPVDYLERTGWCTDRTWVAHCVTPTSEEITRLGNAGVGVAHCPSSNLILSSGVAAINALRSAGCPVGIGVDGSSSADAGSMWLEARQAMLLSRWRDGAHASDARTILEAATLGGAACLGRTDELGTLTPGAVADVAVWPQVGPAYAGAHADPVEAWLRCGPAPVRHTVVDGRAIVRDGALVHPGVDEMLDAHRVAAEAMQHHA
ncbi:MAG: 8-oxoguanine deaminase [Actinomycetota bacterium]